jgi:DNA-binding NarL/FixJ family response regulator
MLVLNDPSRERTPMTLPAQWKNMTRTAAADLGVPEGHVVVLGLLPVGESALAMARLGEVDFSQGVSLDEFVRTIRQLAADGDPREPNSGQLPASSEARYATLTCRERQVMGLIGEGMSNKEIARRLDLAIHTVKTHVHNVLAKLAVRTRLEVAVLVHGARGQAAVPQAFRVA